MTEGGVRGVAEVGERKGGRRVERQHGRLDLYARGCNREPRKGNYLRHTHTHRHISKRADKRRESALGRVGDGCRVPWWFSTVAQHGGRTNSSAAPCSLWKARALMRRGRRACCRSGLDHRLPPQPPQHPRRTRETHTRTPRRAPRPLLPRIRIRKQAGGARSAQTTEHALVLVHCCIP